MNEMRRGTTRLPCACVYAGNSHVAAMLLAAPRRGHADRYSDSAIGVFWPQPPSDGERATVIAPAGVHLIRRYPYDAQEEVGSDDVTFGRAVADQPQSGVLLEVGHYKKGPVSAICLRITSGVSLLKNPRVMLEVGVGYPPISTILHMGSG